MLGIMKTARGFGHVEMKEVEERDLLPHEIRVAVKAAGICSSDLHIRNDDIKLNLKPPVIIGHEWSGIVVEAGASSPLKVGQRVISQTTVKTCGTCYLCVSGHENICSSREIFGYFHHGAFAPRTIVAADRAFVLPDEISFEEGALFEPLCCVIHGMLEVGNVARGSSVVAISGPGTIGLLALQVAKSLDCGTIIIGPKSSSHRLKIAEQFEPNLIVSEGVIDGSWVEPIVKAIGGVDVFVEASGSEEAMRDGLLVTKRRGKYIQLGISGHTCNVDLTQIVYKEVTAVGSIASVRSSWLTALDLVKSGKVNLKPLVGPTFPFDRWQEAFAAAENGLGVKTIIYPQVSSPAVVV